MVATGLVLWCVKRLPQQQKRGVKSFGYRLVEATNAAAVVGLPIACAAYFYANRLFPADMAARAEREIHVFFVARLATLLYACVRPNRRAWLDLLLVASLAYASLPILNAATGGSALWQAVPQGQWVIASFDLVAVVFALTFAFVFRQLLQHKGVGHRKVRPAPVVAGEAA